MVAVLVRLRWAVRRRSVGQPVLLALLWIAAGASGALAAAGSALLVSFADDGAASLPGFVLQMLLMAIMVGWVLMPVTVPQLQDQLVDPVRLEPYPLSTTQRVLGLGVGAMLSPTALFAFLTACGPAFARGMPVVGRAVTLLLATVFAGLCVVLSRLIQSFFAGAMQGRRGRDLSVILAGSLGLGAYLAFQLLPSVIFSEEDDAGLGALVGAALQWLPSGAVGHAALAFRSGGPAAWLGVLVSLAWLVALAAAWGWAMQRAVRGAHHGVDRASRRARAGLTLPPWFIRSLVRTPQSLAAASQHLRYMRRHPRLLQQFAMGLVLGGFVSHTFVRGDWLAAGAAFSAAYMAVILGSGMFNYDGPGASFLGGTGGDLSAALRAKQAVLIGVSVLVGAVFTVVEAAVSGQWRNLAAALLYVLGMALWAASAAVVVSTRFAYDAERSSADRYAAVGPAFVVLLWIGAGIGVVALLYGLVGMWIPREIGALVFVGLGAAIHRASLKRSMAALDRSPELITAKVPAPA